MLAAALEMLLEGTLGAGLRSQRPRAMGKHHMLIVWDRNGH